MKNKIITLISVCMGILCLSFAAIAQNPCSEKGSVRSVTKARSGNFETVTFEIVGDTPEHFAKFQATEYARWKALIEARHISAD